MQKCTLQLGHLVAAITRRGARTDYFRLQRLIYRLVAGVGLFLPSHLAAQEPPDPVLQGMSRFSIAIELGRAVGGPTPGIVEQLVQAGFDQTILGGCAYNWLLDRETCISTQTYPTKSPRGVAATVTARWMISSRWAVGGGVGSVRFGESRGYSGGAYVDVSYDALEIWAAGYWQPLPWVRVGGGPALYRVHESYSGKTVSRLGLMSEAGIEVPIERGFYVQLGVRGHFVPSATVHDTVGVPITLRPSWSHVAFAGGVGLRF